MLLLQVHFLAVHMEGVWKRTSVNATPNILVRRASILPALAWAGMTPRFALEREFAVLWIHACVKQTTSDLLVPIRFATTKILRTLQCAALTGLAFTRNNALVFQNIMGSIVK